MSDDQPLDAGSKPKLGWLPVARLVVDERYQRSLDSRRSQKLIDHIVEGFSWSAFQAVVVAEQGENWTVIDGQHRVEAARRRGESHVPAVIIEALSVAQQAAIFVSANLNRVAVNPIALHHAALAAGDPEAQRIKQLCDEAGILVPRKPIPAKRLGKAETLSIGAIGAIIEKHGYDVALLAAKNVAAAWCEYRGGISATILRSVAAVLSAEDDKPRAAVNIFGALTKLKPWEFKEQVQAEAEAIEISNAMAAERVVKRLMRGATPVHQIVPATKAPPPARAADPDRVVTPSMMTDEERLSLMVRQGAPITRIMAAFKISKADALRRIQDCRA